MRLLLVWPWIYGVERGTVGGRRVVVVGQSIYRLRVCPRIEPKSGPVSSLVRWSDWRSGLGVAVRSTPIDGSAFLSELKVTVDIFRDHGS
jgi:hypothetical protein